MTFKEYSYRVCDAFIVALFYGDVSGLEEEDIVALERFLASELPHGGHWSLEDDAEPHFACCDIVGLHGNVYDLTYMVPVAD